MKETITSLQNPKVKLITSLKKRKNREETDLFLIEGYREISCAIDACWQIDILFFCKELFLGENESVLMDTAEKKGTLIIQCPPTVFAKISYRDRPDGLLAIAPQYHRDLQDLEEKIQKKKNPFFVIAESIEKPGNLGTIIRSSDAAGAAGIIICDRCTDLHNPNVVRASVGTLFSTLIVEATSEQTFAFLQKHNISIIAATPHADKIYTEENLVKPIAIALGTEQYGLSQQWLKHADLQVKIPMMGKADSLNVSSATTLLLYEALRQRT